MGRGLHKFEPEEVDVIMQILGSGSYWRSVVDQYKTSTVLSWLRESQYDYVEKQIRYIATMVRSGGASPLPDMHKFLREFFTIRNLFKMENLPQIAVKLRMDWGGLLIRSGYQTRRERRKWGMTKVPPPVIT